jgi:glutathione S-transferase
MTVVNIRFYRLLPERHAFPIAFFHREMERLYGVLELGLAGRDYLVGDGRGKYSIADMACWTMVNTSIFIGVGELSPRWPNVAAWRDRIWARPAAQRAVNVPVPNVNGNEVVSRKLAEDEKFAKGHAELQMALNKALGEFPA